MSAVCLNPVVLKEMHRLSSALRLKNAHKAKKNLFGSVNRKMFEKSSNDELKKIEEIAKRTWDFDFRTARPVLTPKQYIWEQIDLGSNSRDHVPLMYVSQAHVREITNASEQSSPEEVREEKRKVQLKITEYMKKRKRLAAPTLKSEQPQKKLRSSSNSNNNISRSESFRSGGPSTSRGVFKNQPNY